ncbi:hypothetical protein PUN28_001281 [Cardiocondyla obscurior]|uniref:Secreted protein n=1 Tax=Cardiocondyla obscurior TaxID=286306 RepID=A0AAW2H466_9HYME
MYMRVANKWSAFKIFLSIYLLPGVVERSVFTSGDFECTDEYTARPDAQNSFRTGSRLVSMPTTTGRISFCASATFVFTTPPIALTRNRRGMRARCAIQADGDSAGFVQVLFDVPNDTITSRISREVTKGNVNCHNNYHCTNKFKKQLKIYKIFIAFNSAVINTNCARRSRNDRHYTLLISPYIVRSYKLVSSTTRLRRSRACNEHIIIPGSTLAQ